MKTQAIIPAGGSGIRFGGPAPKPLAKLNGVPLFVHCLRTLQKSPWINSIIVVGPRPYLPIFRDTIQRESLTKISQVIAGGRTRRESVAKGLGILERETDLVLIHDGVRPLLTLELIRDVIEACRKFPAATAAVPIKPTVKRVDPERMIVTETLERKTLWEVQTPQVFHREIILQAHESWEGPEATDDAVMVERLGKTVKVVMGDSHNIKITTPEDMVTAQSLLRSRKIFQRKKRHVF